MLKNWVFILVLAAIGIALFYYWFSIHQPIPGVTPQGGDSDSVTALVALVAAIVSLGSALFGVLGKYFEYKKAQLEIEEKHFDLDRKKQGSAEE